MDFLISSFHLSYHREVHDKHQTKGQELVFRDICVRIDKRDILKQVNGLAKPGEMLAIMGPSGKL